MTTTRGKESMMKRIGTVVVGRDLVGGKWERTELGRYKTEKAARFAYYRRHQYANFSNIDVEPIYTFAGSDCSSDPFAIFN